MSEKIMSPRERRAAALNAAKLRLAEEKEAIEESVKPVGVDALPRLDAAIPLSAQKTYQLQEERRIAHSNACHALSGMLTDVTLAALPLDTAYIQEHRNAIENNCHAVYVSLMENGTLPLNAFSLNESHLVRQLTRGVILGELPKDEFQSLVEAAASEVKEKTKAALREEISAAKDRKAREDELKGEKDEDKTPPPPSKKKDGENKPEPVSADEDVDLDDDDDDEKPSADDTDDGDDISSDKDSDDDSSLDDSDVDLSSTDDKDESDDKDDDDKDDKSGVTKKEEKSDDDSSKKDDKEKTKPLKESFMVPLNVIPTLTRPSTRFGYQPTLMGRLLSESAQKCTLHEAMNFAGWNGKTNFDAVLAESVISYTVIETLSTLRLLAPETTLRHIQNF